MGHCADCHNSSEGSSGPSPGSHPFPATPTLRTARVAFPCKSALFAHRACDRTHKGKCGLQLAGAGRHALEPNVRMRTSGNVPQTKKFLALHKGLRPCVTRSHLRDPGNGATKMGQRRTGKHETGRRGSRASGAHRASWLVRGRETRPCEAPPTGSAGTCARHGARHGRERQSRPVGEESPQRSNRA